MKSIGIYRDYSMAKKPRFSDESETEKQVKRVLMLLKSQDEHRQSKIERIKKLIQKRKYKISPEKNN